MCSGTLFYERYPGPDSVDQIHRQAGHFRSSFVLAIHELRYFALTNRAIRAPARPPINMLLATPMQSSAPSRSIRASHTLLCMAAAAFVTGTLALTRRTTQRLPSICPATSRRCPTTAAAMPAPAAYEQMTTLLREVSELHAALGILGWDEQTMLPAGAAAARGRQKAALAGVAHEKAASPALAQAIAACEKEVDGLPDAYAKANVRDARRGYEHTARVSKELAMEKEGVESEGYAAWTVARGKDDWAGFAPMMANGLEVFKKYATATRPEMQPYDAAIDMFERGMTAERLAEIFDGIAPPLKGLLEKVRKAKENAPPVKEMLKGGEHWDTEAQARLCKKLAERLSFDFEKGRIDVSHHPFTGGAGPEDTRITTRYSTQVPWEGIMGTVHEVGYVLRMLHCDLECFLRWLDY